MMRAFCISILLLLLLANRALVAEAAACTIPPTVFIQSDDACATWGKVKRSWDEARKRVWKAYDLINWEQPEFPDTAWGNMGFVVIEERPGSTFWDSGKEWCGLFTPLLVRITFASDCITDPLTEEMAHWFLWRYRDRYGEETWKEFGHGNAQDLIVKNLNRLVRELFYPHLVSGAELRDSRQEGGEVN